MSACAGKRRFLDRRDAKRVESKMRREGHDPGKPYQCDACSQWHLGHKGVFSGLRADVRAPDNVRLFMSGSHYIRCAECSDLAGTRILSARIRNGRARCERCGTTYTLTGARL